MINRQKTKYMVQLSLMAALVVVVAFVPFLGYIPLVFIKATTVHIPVIIGAILLGPKAGAVLGGVFGLTSIIKNTMEPNLSSFVFSPFIPVPGADAGSPKALFISMVPRILIGVVTALLFRLFSKLFHSKRTSCVLAGLAGAITNTILVMGSIYVLFGQQYAAVKQVAFEKLAMVLMGVVFTNGLAEAVVAAVLAGLIVPPLLKNTENSRI